jgi:hypothetical protein
LKLYRAPLRLHRLPEYLLDRLSMNKRHRSLSASSSSSSSSSNHPPSRPPSPPSHKLFRTNDPSTSSDSTWTCSLPPTCSSSRESTFSSPAEFEAHHRQFHRIVCHASQTQGGHGKGKERECGCVFPEQRMLDLVRALLSATCQPLRVRRKGEQTDEKLTFVTPPAGLYYPP